MGFLFPGWRWSAWPWRNAHMFIHLQSLKILTKPSNCWSSESSKNLWLSLKTNRKTTKKGPNQPTTLVVHGESTATVLHGGGTWWHPVAGFDLVNPVWSKIKSAKDAWTLYPYTWIYLLSRTEKSANPKYFPIADSANLRWTLRILDMEDKAIFIWPAWIGVWWIPPLVVGLFVPCWWPRSFSWDIWRSARKLFDGIFFFFLKM